MKPEETFVGQPIRSLQTMLRVLAEHDGRYLRLVPDGIYGPETMAAVSRFQKNNTLPITGIANLETWEAIAQAYELALIEEHQAQTLQILLNPGQIIHRGECSLYMYLVQAMLQAFAQCYHCLDAPGHTGALDAATADALASFQQLSGLPMTGELDKATWKHLALQYPLAVSSPEVPKR